MPFPTIDLDASAPATSYHKVVLTITTKQDNVPWASQVTTYEHTTDAVVAIITGNIASLGGKMGPKGNRPKGSQFDLEVKLEVDGQNITVPPAQWNDVSREFILAAERGLLEMWMHMNDESFKANKAHGKI